jgi:hypothetical protein
MLATGTWAYRGSAVPLAKIERLRRLAWLIDAIGRVPGTRFRFGINSVIGLAPGVGDAVLALISLVEREEPRRWRFTAGFVHFEVFDFARLGGWQR